MNAYPIHHHYYFLTFSLNYKRRGREPLWKHGLSERETKGKKVPTFFSLKDLPHLTLGEWDAGFHYNNVISLWSVLKPI